MGMKNGKPELKDEDAAAIAEKSGLSTEQIKEDFNNFIKDHPKGKLNKKDFKQCFTVASGSGKGTDAFVQNVFRMFDSDNNGYITFVEFMVILQILDNGSNEEKLLHCFKMFDVNNDGSITKKELVKIFKIICAANNAPNPEAKAMTRVSDQAFAELDADGNGKITQDEFIAAATSGQELVIPSFDEFMGYSQEG